MKISINRDELMKKKGLVDVPDALSNYQLDVVQTKKVKVILIESAVSMERESSIELSLFEREDD